MKIGELFHIVHVVDDLPAAEEWYDAVFGPDYMFRRHESALDNRTATMMIFADFPIEPMAPHPGKAGAEGVIGRFRARFGERLHSIAFYCDSVAEGYERFRSNGIRVTADGGLELSAPPTRGGIYAHPRDSYGLVELMEPRIAGAGGAPVGDTLGECYDPRLLGTHQENRWQTHPSGVIRTSHLTVVVDDIERAMRFYVDNLDAVLLHEVLTAAPRRRSAYLVVGPSTIIELAQPGPGTEEAAGLERDGSMLWSATFLVENVAATAEHLAANGYPAVIGSDGVLVGSVRGARGARYLFSETAVVGDPRGAGVTTTEST